jgi:hypothetical protein
MPNWCNNTVNIRHDDPAMIERVRKAFLDGRLLDEFIPVPQALRDTVSGFMGEDKRAEHEAQQAANVEKHGYANWYDFCVNEWGTKWDIGADGQPALDQDGGGLVLNFDSAWSPPIGAYEKLMAMGFEILAYYYEPGMAFAGKWDNGDDDYYEYGGMNSDEIAETLPDDLDETFCISESAAEWEAENQEIDLDDGLSAVNEQEQQK